MESVILFFFMLLFFGAIGLVIYKYHRELRRWLKDPKRGKVWYPNRETVLRRRIEDAQAEIEWLKEKPDEEEEGGDA